MKMSRNICIHWGHLLLCRRLPLLGVVLSIALVGIAGCGPYSDQATAAREHRKQLEERTEGLRDYTARTKRGTELAGQELVDALSGRTLVYHYGSFLDGRRGDYVTYHYYRPNGRLVYVDNWLDSSGKGRKGDYWKVTGQRLCVLRQSFSPEPSCYRVARTDDGAIQFYTDDTTKPYHGLLTTSTREIIEGPPPPVSSVLKSPL
jgi:hypothetical protein